MENKILLKIWHKGDLVLAKPVRAAELDHEKKRWLEAHPEFSGTDVEMTIAAVPLIH